MQTVRLNALLRMYRFFLILLFFGLSQLNVFGTAQMPDKLIFKGKKYALHSNPLEEYFERFPEKRPEGGIISTALWRGYVATFKIQNNKLVLHDLEIEKAKNDDKGDRSYYWVSVIDQYFPKEERILDYYSGLLILPHGKLVNYVHMGYASTYENYILLKVLEGNLIESDDLTSREYEEFRVNQFDAFKKTDKYKTMFRELVEQHGKEDESFIHMFLFDFGIEYMSVIHDKPIKKEH